MQTLIEQIEALNNDQSHFTCSNDICTPIGCVEEMVNTIPASFWNKEVQVLDPCAGNGNFYGYVKKFLPLSSIVFNEINNKRIQNIKQLFGDNATITTQDFLQYDEAKKFDLVMANPPFAAFKNGKRVAKNHNLSRLFIRKALRIVKENGLLLFIAPDNWMSLSDRNTLPKLLSQYQFLHLNIHGAKRWFPKVGSSFSWFLLKKSPNAHPFTIDNFYLFKEKSHASLPSNSTFIPLFYNSTVASIFNKTIHASVDKYLIQTSSNLHRHTKKNLLNAHRSETYPFKILHTPSQTLWGSQPHKFQEGWKVFLSLTNKYKTFIDACGMTQSIAFIRAQDKKHAENIAHELRHPIYLFLNYVTRYGNFNNIRILQRFPTFNNLPVFTNKENHLLTKFFKQYNKGNPTTYCS